MEDQRARFSMSRQLMNHEWSQQCSMGKITLYVHLRTRQKWLPTGTTSHPRKDDPSFRVREWKNNMVISKLSSIIDNKTATIPFLRHCYEIRTVPTETYQDNKNTASRFLTIGDVHNLRQGNMSVTQYYCALGHFRKQLDVFWQSWLGMPMRSKEMVEEIETLNSF